MTKRFCNGYFNTILFVFLVVVQSLSHWLSMNKDYNMNSATVSSRITNVSFVLYQIEMITNRNTYSIDDEQYLCSKRKANGTSHVLTGDITYSFLSVAQKYSLSNTIILSVKRLSISCLHGQTCKEYTILTLLAMYRRLYGINVVVFTDDSFTMKVVREFGFIDHRIIHHNEYGLPFLKYLFIDAMKVSQTRIYTYINADIFVNIKILQAAEAYYHYRQNGVLIEK